LNKQIGKILSLKFQIFQRHTIVGDIENNFILLKKAYLDSVKLKCDFFLTPEMYLSGYPPKDLLLRNDFNKKLIVFQEKIKKLTRNRKTLLVLGTPQKKYDGLFNSAIVFQDGKILKEFTKIVLPNYGVFDEKRYFISGAISDDYFLFQDKKIRILICEDIWDDNLISKISNKGYDFLLVINASPFEKDKFMLRYKLIKKRVRQFNAPLIYLNSSGSQDDLIFDGGSFLMNENGEIEHQNPFFINSSNTFTYNPRKKNKKKKKIVKLNYNKNLYDALVVSLRNYFNALDFKNIVVAISGGIDSALSAVIACDAVGNKNVKGYYLPSKFSSNESMNDAKTLSKNLKIQLVELSIINLFNEYINTLNPEFKNFSNDVTEENIQSRIRGSMMMAISNKFNSLLITTGNKSELAVGYSTIYGDMCGGYSILKDVYKTEVMKLAKFRNLNFSDLCLLKKFKIIPKNIISKEPTAELRYNQKDSDSLPSYKLLDKVLFCLIEKNMSLEEIKNLGFDKQIILDIWNMIKNSEFKRFQSVLGPKISIMNFDSDRRFPIINKFKIDNLPC
tara:strand:+ start:14810 stop:16492 length:1683 start_codon:yes stop_codon:yes gene_type:complete